MRFVLPCIEDVRMPATEQSLLVHYPASRGIDDECVGFAASEEGFVAEMIGGIVQGYMEGDDITICRDLIEGNTDAFGWVIEENVESAPLRHLGYERTDMTDTDDTEGRCIGDWRLEIED